MISWPGHLCLSALGYLFDNFPRASAPVAREALPTFLYVTSTIPIASVNAHWKQGALIIEDAADTPYGDRRATVRDSWGNTRQIATHKPHQRAMA
jgi:uncharacterized glyoxalase superfamily protein PhnB